MDKGYTEMKSLFLNPFESARIILQHKIAAFLIERLGQPHFMIPCNHRCIGNELRLKLTTTNNL